MTAPSLTRSRNPDAEGDRGRPVASSTGHCVVGVLNAVIRDLVSVLDAIEKKKAA